MRITDPHSGSIVTAGRRPSGRRPFPVCGMVLCGLLVLATACSEPAERQSAVPPGTIVDSIFPIEEEIRRFRATLADAPDRLGGGAESRDDLVGKFVAAVEAADTSAFSDLLLTRSEFAHLYYPFTMYTHPPYELSPSLLWFQMENGSSRGFGRLMERLAGQPLHFTGYRCDPEPRAEDGNRVWVNCRLEVAPPEGQPTEIALFGSILERDGVFKFVSYSNDL